MGSSFANGLLLNSYHTQDCLAVRHYWWSAVVKLSLSSLCNQPWLCDGSKLATIWRTVYYSAHIHVVTHSFTCTIIAPSMCLTVSSQESPMLLATQHTEPEIISHFFLPTSDSASDSRSKWCLFIRYGSYDRFCCRIHPRFAPSLSLDQKMV